MFGYEIRESLLEKWGRQCAYCDASEVPLEIEHVEPKARGGSDRVSNLTLACRKCNQKKGDRPVEKFLQNEPERLQKIQSQRKAPLKDAATVNTTRWALYRALQETGLPVSVGTGGQTKYNRCRLGLPKEHWLDAACVGDVDTLSLRIQKPLYIVAAGRGRRVMANNNKHGFPIAYMPRQKRIKGFETGDMVRAIVTNGKKIGTYLGKVAVRTSGSFKIKLASGEKVDGISYKYCRPVHQKDGYIYGYGAAPDLPEEE